MGILNMKRMLLLLAFIAPVVVFAEPSSQIAWTPELLNLVKKGNADKGKVLAESCKSCHGDKGQGMKEETRDDEVLPAIPALAGQVATYTYKQLRDYLSGSRSHVQMTGVAKGLSEQDAADLAVWFSSLPRAENKSGSEKLARAEKMVEQGDGKRILPPCFVCHGSKGQGEKQDIPALAGQQANYFTRTLLDYKTGQRHNDVYSRMRLIAQQLSEDEIKELAQYYQQLK
jgi:cytochrome c553